LYNFAPPSSGEQDIKKSGVFFRRIFCALLAHLQANRPDFLEISQTLNHFFDTVLPQRLHAIGN
jgi:hypothetical protein